MTTEQPITTGTNTVEFPVQRDRDRAAAQVEQANAQFAKMVADYQAAPAQALERDRAWLNRLQNDPHHLNQKLAGNAMAQNEESALIARIAVAESRLESERLDHAIAGEKIDLPGMIETTVNGQLPMADMVAAVEPMIERGVRPELIKTFLMTGRGDDPLGREEEIRAAKEWKRRLETDPEMQKKFLAKDPVVMRQFDVFGMVAEDPRKVTHE